MQRPDLSALGVLAWERPMTGGHRNAVWRVMTARGPAVAKSTAHDAAGLEWLLPVQAAARAAGFVVPALHRATDGRQLVDGWTVEDFVAGKGFAAGDMAGLGPRIQAFHKAVPAMVQRPGLLSVAEVAKAPLPRLPRDVAALCRAVLAPFADAATQPIHGDMTAANLIHTADGTALIDWDEARCDLPFLDLVHATDLPRPEARAHLAWEVITGWDREPAYAKTCADRLAQA